MTNPIVDAFVWGAGGAKKTPEQVAREREIAEAILMKAGNTSPVGHWTQGAARVVDALGGVLKERRAAAGEAEIADVNKGLISSLLSGSGSAPASSPASSAIPMTGAAGEVAATAPSRPVDMTGNEVFSQFIDTVKQGGVQNPYALAAIAATGQRESQFSPGNVNRTWSDPSESGQPGTAGGIMSWRGPRYEALAATGDLSPAGQAKFFLQENPQLIQALNNAGSVEEAQSLMNKAWAFAGHDRPGGETAARLASAQSFLPTFQGGGEVAAATPEAAIEAISPTQGGSLTDEVAAFEQTPAYSAQFPGQTAQGGLRPFRAGESRPNPDGSYSTEITTTWQLPDGAWVNVPSLWMGANGPQQFSPDDEGGILGAMQTFEAQNGPAFQRFGSEQEAVAAAEARSQAGGAGAGQQGAVPQLSAPVEVPALPVAGPQDAVAQAITQQPVEVAGGGGRQGGINPAIIEALTNPQASPQTQRVAAILLEQEQRRMQAAEEQRLQAADPIRQLQLQKGQLELEQIRNPGVDGVAVGNRIVDRRTGKVVYEAPQDAKAPELVELFDEKTGLPYKAQYNSQTKQFERVGGIKAPSGTSLTVSPDGQVSFTQGGAKPLTESQSKLTLFQSLQTETQPILLDLESQFNPANLADAAARSTPIAGNFFQSEQGQIYSAASTAWAEGALRIATGAAATPEEMERTKRAYFAQPGDTPNAIAFKAQMREMYNRSIDRSLGKKDVTGSLPKPSDFAKKFDDEDEAPEGVDASDWEFMTPEERRLFKQ